MRIVAEFLSVCVACLCSGDFADQVRNKNGKFFTPQNQFFTERLSSCDALRSGAAGRIKMDIGDDNEPAPTILDVGDYEEAPKFGASGVPIGLSIAWRAASTVPRAVGSVNSGRNRAIAAAHHARDVLVADLPVHLGGLAITAPPPSSRPASAAPTPRAVGDSIPPAQLVWEAELPEVEKFEEAHAFCVRFSCDAVLLAAGLGDGTVRILRASDGGHVHTLDKGPQKKGVRLPITCLRWRPAAHGAVALPRTLLTADAAGGVSHWQVDDDARLTHTLTEDDAGHQVYSLDYRPDATAFATAGQDTVVRIYDEATLSLTTTLQAGDLGFPGAAPGHTSRVFSLKWDPSDPQLLLSAGWDNTVHFWDLRVGSSVGSLYGPHVCGDALDVRGNEVLTGAYKPTKQVQIWDVRTRELISTVPYRQALDDEPTLKGKPNVPCKIYSTSFAAHDDGTALIVAAGSGCTEGSGELRVFTRDGFTPIARHVQSKAIYSVHATQTGRLRFAVTGGDNRVKVLELADQPLPVELA